MKKLKYCLLNTILNVTLFSDESVLDNSSSEDENYDDFDDDDQDSGHEKMNGKAGGSEDEGMDMSD